MDASARLLPERTQELGFRFARTMLEHVESERAIAAQLGAQADQGHRLLVCLEKACVHLQRTLHAEDREGQVRGRQPFERAEIGRAVDDDSSEALDGPFASGARSLAPEVPPVAHEIVRRRHLQCVPVLPPMHDPPAVLAEAPPDFGQGDVDRVTRDVRPRPAFRDHGVVVDHRADVIEQHPQRMKDLRPQMYFGAVARQPGRIGTQQKRAESEFRHVAARGPRGARLTRWSPVATIRALDAVRYTQRVLHGRGLACNQDVSGAHERERTRMGARWSGIL